MEDQMESIINRNMKAKIKANYRDTQTRKARIDGKKSHGAKVLERNVFMAIFGILFGFFKRIKIGASRLFNRPKRIRSWCVKTPYHYDGEPHAKGIIGKRFGVYMREKGRKYKKNRRAA
jgi:hypothetical protein